MQRLSDYFFFGFGFIMLFTAIHYRIDFLSIIIGGILFMVFTTNMLIRFTPQLFVSSSSDSTFRPLPKDRWRGNFFRIALCLVIYSVINAFSLETKKPNFEPSVFASEAPESIELIDITIEEFQIKKPKIELPKAIIKKEPPKIINKIKLVEDPAPEEIKEDDFWESDIDLNDIIASTDEGGFDEGEEILPAKKETPKEEAPSEPINFAQEMPLLPGCEMGSYDERYKCANQKLLDYIGTQTKYPPIAKENNIEGRTIISFIVEKDGSLSAIDIVRDPGGGLADELIRVVKSMPKWVPGKQQGNAVRVQYNLPVKFSLE